MASSFKKSTIKLLLFLCALSVSSASLVVDTDGDPVRNGGRYYIIPRVIGFGGGLCLTCKPGITCPFYITQSGRESDGHIPVKITSPLKVNLISTGLQISIAFQDTKNMCKLPMGWYVVLDEATSRHYVSTGGFGIPFNPMETFTIEVSPQNNKDDDIEYKIKSPALQRSIGLFQDDALLGLTNEIPLPVAFKKAPGFELLMNE